jgi:hypothetical protein
LQFLESVMNNIALASPSEMSARARAGEIASILAAAIVRSVVANQPKLREVGLGFAPDQSVHTTPYQQEKL